MATVMKITINLKINKDAHTSTSFEHILDSVDDAREAGTLDKALFDAWMEGYGNAA